MGRGNRKKRFSRGMLLTSKGSSEHVLQSRVYWIEK
jgi:hypothetical protein